MLIRFATPIFLVLSIVALASAGRPALSQNAQIQGLVVDDKDNPLRGVHVVLQSPSLPDPIEEHTTDNMGGFSLDAGNVRPGREIHLRLDGYVDFVLPIGAQHLVVAKIQLTMTRSERLAEAAPPSRRAPKPTPVPSRELLMSDDRKRAIQLYNEGVEEFEEADDNEAKKKAAEQKFRQAASIDPTFAEPHRLLLRIAIKQKNWAGASRYADDLIRIDPNDNEAIRTLYLALVLLRHFDRVGDAAVLLAKTDPETVSTIEEHAQTFFENDLYVMARALYQALTEIYPKSPDAYLNLGLCCASLGDVEGTRAAFEVFLEVAPKDHPNYDTVKADLASLYAPLQTGPVAPLLPE